MDNSTFFSWSCVTIHHLIGVTTDIVVKDRISMYALLRVLEIKINGADPNDDKILGRYIKLRFLQIVAFEAWQKQYSLEMLFKSAV